VCVWGGGGGWPALRNIEGVAAKTEEADRCGCVTVEAGGQSSRCSGGLEECARSGVDESGVEEADSHDRRARPAAPVMVQAAATERVGDGAVRASGSSGQAVLVSCGRLWWQRMGSER
jgi:hypothetical protein